MREEPRSFVLAVSGLDGLVITGAPARIDVPAGDVASIPLRLVAPTEAVPGMRNDVVIRICDVDDATICFDADTRFLGPSR
jgi:hypothetical protein